MNTPLAVIALCACALWLSACDRTPAPQPTPKVDRPAQSDAGPSTATVASPSVPSAESVFPTANPAKVDATQGRSNSTMSAAQESTAMPLPGQNNDHSAPQGPAKSASAP